MKVIKRVIGANTLRLWPMLVAVFTAPAFAGDVDSSAVTSLKVDIAAVKELGTVSAVDGMTASGQPDAAALEVFAESGYAAVIDLRGPDEERGFDQQAAVEDLGMDYINLPVVGRDGVSFDNAGKLSDILDRYDAPVLVHCGSSNRVGALVALGASLDGAADDAALEAGREAGLTRLEGVVRERLEAD